MIDLPPPSYEQTIEAVVQCDIPQKNVSIAYKDYLQSDEVAISDLGPLTETKLRCLKNAVDPFYILTIEDTPQRAAFYDFSDREDRPKEKADAQNWLRAKRLLESVPSFDANQGIEEFAAALEQVCGIEKDSALMGDDSWITIKSDFLSLDSLEETSSKYECLSRMFTASNAFENGIRIGFIGNEAYVSEEQK